MVVKITLCILSMFVVLGTIASFVPMDDWWVRVFDFPRGILIAIGIVTILGLLFTQSLSHPWVILLILMLAASITYQGTKIFPYTPLAKKEVMKAEVTKVGDTVSLLVSNVLMDNRDYDKLLNLVRDKDPSLLLTLETDKKWENAIGVIEQDYPYTVKVPLDNLYGMHLYSKYKLEDMDVVYILDKDIPSIHGKVVLPSGKRVNLHCLHPKPPAPNESKTSTKRDVELLIVGKRVKKHEGTTIVAGDLNDVAWSNTAALFRKVSGLLDPRKGRGLYNTFHADYPLARWPLDHVFHSNDFTLIEMERLSHIGSDHFPIFISLFYNPPAEEVQKEKEASEEEVEEANEKIENGLKEGD
ncbi:endonuclease/exonuclease/phosphatase family protein [Limibacter armeniacum]|uniref:endonuclease/exonuclease/phosphatase family protein n=1 Tax=Limibacter armeniacum TaxID=466084 RepID=UPI002FE56FBD